jgi:hypothetical protein
MSREQESVLNVVTAEMDKRENKFLKWLFFGLLATVSSITVAAFILGFKIQATLNEVNSMSAWQDVTRAETKARVDEWAAWRKSVDDGNLKSAGDRFTATDFDTAASIFNMKMPPVDMPYTREIQQRSRKP